MEDNLEYLQHIGDVHGHLVDLRGVILLDITKDANIVGFDEVDRHTLPPESS